MDIPETRYARSADGASIAYQVFGDADVDLLWISPWFSHLELMWEYPPVVRFHEAMASFARVILLDQRGLGLSDRSRGLPDLETRMDDLRAVLDAANSHRTVLWGGGPDGGALCAMLAATYPERVIALAFWNARPREAWAQDYPLGMTDEEEDRITSIFVAGWGIEARTAEICRLGGDLSVAADPDAVRWAAKVCRYMASPGDLEAFIDMYRKIDFRSILPSIHVPTIHIYTDDDDGQAALLSDSIAGAKSVLLPWRGDFTVWPTSTTDAVTALRDFVEEIGERDAALDRVLATVLFTDIVDSTVTAAVVGDARWRTLIEEHHRAAKAVVARYRGEYVESTGDGLLATFDGPARAIRCAEELRTALAPLGLQIRAGAHTGEITRTRGGVAGLGVHIAARVAAMAGPDEVWVSSTVKDLTAGSGLAFEDVGEHELKGVPDRWRLYRTG